MSKKLFEVAQAAKIGLIVQVKDNQPTLKHAIERLTATTAPHDTVHSRDHGRNRDETRIVTVFGSDDALAGTDWHTHVATIIRVERSVATRNPATGLLRQTSETAFYIANQPLIALSAGPPTILRIAGASASFARAAGAIRAHWTIENTSHYARDVTMGEDQSRIRNNPGIFARLRSFGFNIFMARKIGTLSQDRYRAALTGVRHLLSLTPLSGSIEQPWLPTPGASTNPDRGKHAFLSLQKIQDNIVNEQDFALNCTEIDSEPRLDAI